MAGRVIVVERSGVGYHHDIALNYTQLSLDYGETSRVAGKELKYQVVDKFHEQNYSDCEWVLVVKAGTIFLWGAFEHHYLEMAETKFYRYIYLHNNVYIYKPAAVQHKIINSPYVTSLDTSSQASFFKCHTDMLTDIIDDSNISYIMHNELPVFGEFTKPIDWAITVSSGFFVNSLLQHHGFHNNTRVLHIDISKISLQVRRYTIENWDGVDIVEWTQHLQQKFPSMQLFNRKKFTSEDNKWLEVWEDVKRLFGDDWLQHWQKYKKLHHSYHRINISTDDIASVLDKAGDGQGLIWWNGALKRIPSNLLKTSEHSHDMAKSFVSRLTNKDKTVICYGSDHCNQQYNGISSQQVFDQIQKENSRDNLWQ